MIARTVSRMTEDERAAGSPKTLDRALIAYDDGLPVRCVMPMPASAAQKGLDSTEGAKCTQYTTPSAKPLEAKFCNCG